MTASFVRFGARWGAAALVLAFLAPVRSATAQGVTSGAVTGTVTDDAGAGVTGANLSLTNSATGQRYSGQTRADGRFMFENVQVGGPYVLEARAPPVSPWGPDALSALLGGPPPTPLQPQPAP